MIRVTIYKNEKHQCVGFKAHGHAGFSEEGQDIVCAAVSVLTINTLNAIEKFADDIVNVNRFFYNMLQTPSFLARDFEMCKRCINVGGITYDNAVKLNRMVCMLFEGYFKDVYENGIEEEQITERVKLMVDDVDTIVMALANNLKGYKGYRK